MSETKAVFAERATQSFKHIIHRYIENHGEKLILKLTKFVSTMNCRVSTSIGKSPRVIENFLSFLILNNKPLTNHKKPKFKFGE